MYNLRFWGGWKLWGFVTLQAFLSAVLTFLYKFCGCTARFSGSLFGFVLLSAVLNRILAILSALALLYWFCKSLRMWKWTRITQSVQGLAASWTVVGSYPGGSEISIPALGPTQSLVIWVSGFFPVGKRPARSLDHPVPYSAEVEEIVKLYL